MAKHANHERRAHFLWHELTKRARRQRRRALRSGLRDVFVVPDLSWGGAPTNYGALCDWLGEKADRGVPRPHPLALSWPLGLIQAHCEQEGFPRLQSLVVNAGMRVPGRGYKGSTVRKQLRVDQAAAIMFDWPRKNPFVKRAHIF